MAQTQVEDVVPAEPRPRGAALATEVLLQVLRQPERHDQVTWVGDSDIEINIARRAGASRPGIPPWFSRTIEGWFRWATPTPPDDVLAIIGDRLDVCGTTLCLAGWTLMLGADQPVKAVTLAALGQTWVPAALELLELRSSGSSTWDGDVVEVTMIFDETFANDEAITRFAAVFGVDLDALRDKVAGEIAAADVVEVPA